MSFSSDVVRRANQSHDVARSRLLIEDKITHRDAGNKFENRVLTDCLFVV